MRLAKRVNHQGVMFPTPNRLLLEGMALAGYIAFANSISLEVEGEIKDWDETSDFVREAWVDSARAMFAMLAVASGATVTEIPEIPKDK
ncbi:MAG: hypothetical protein CMC15_17210 [Flavobacteriaceae bacterium]|nr:hypothetical protein [Flavobacteriaceae bacterium]